MKTAVLKNFIFQGENTPEVEMQVSRYAVDDTLAVRLWAEEPLATLSVNLSEYDLSPGPRCFWVKEIDLDLAKELEQLGVIQATGRRVVYAGGRAEALEHRFTPKWARFLDI